MKISLRTTLAVVAFSIAAPYSSVRAQDAPKVVQPANEQLQSLQGTWEGIEQGREAEGKCTLTISGESIHFQGTNKGEWYKATFTLPPGTDPKQLHGIIKDCPAQDFVGKSALAIFKIQDGILTLVGNPPGSIEAPKSFEGDANSRTFVFKKAPSQ